MVYPPIDNNKKEVRKMGLRRVLFGADNATCMNIVNGSGFLGQTREQTERIGKLSKRLFGDNNGNCMNISTDEDGYRGGVLGEALSRIEKLEAELKTLKNRRPSRPRPAAKRKR